MFGCFLEMRPIRSSRDVGKPSSKIILSGEPLYLFMTHAKDLQA